MKKRTGMLLAMALGAVLAVTGCGKKEAETPVDMQETAQVQEGTKESEKTETEAEVAARYEKDVYADQLSVYAEALEDEWEMDNYFAADMSPLPVYYYEGDKMENIGYAVQDLDFNGRPELIIGAIEGKEMDPVVLELWTADENGKAVKLCTSYERDRYYLEWHKEGSYMLENQASSSAANFARYYYGMDNGKLTLVQAVVFDAIADEENPWFAATDTDWDTGNDEPIEEDMAMGIMESHAGVRIALDYIPFAQYTK